MFENGCCKEITANNILIRETIHKPLKDGLFTTELAGKTHKILSSLRFVVWRKIKLLLTLNRSVRLVGRYLYCSES